MIVRLLTTLTLFVFVMGASCDKKDKKEGSTPPPSQDSSYSIDDSYSPDDSAATDDAATYDSDMDSDAGQDDYSSDSDSPEQ